MGTRWGTLTPAGQLLARHGRDIVDQVGVAAMEVAALREGIAGIYRVTAFPTAARSFVAQAWRQLVEDPASGPALRLVELEPPDSLPALAAGEVDLAVTHSYSNMAQMAHPGVETTQIAQEEVFLAVPRTASSTPPSRSRRQADPAGEPVRLADFAREDWIIPHHRWSCYEMIERACGLAGFAPHAVAEATDFSTQLALIASGVGVALIPELGCIAVPERVLAAPTRPARAPTPTSRRAARLASRPRPHPAGRHAPRRCAYHPVTESMTPSELQHAPGSSRFASHRTRGRQGLSLARHDG